MKLPGHPSPAPLSAAGLHGEYFHNSTFSGTPALVCTASRIWFEAHDFSGGNILATWGHGEPAPGIQADGFSVRWSGVMEPRFSEPYRIITETDRDASIRVWMGGELIIDDWAGNEFFESARIGRRYLCRRATFHGVRLQRRNLAAAMAGVTPQRGL